MYPEAKIQLICRTRNTVNLFPEMWKEYSVELVCNVEMRIKKTFKSTIDSLQYFSCASFKETLH
jgi:hypothetical protein